MAVIAISSRVLSVVPASDLQLPEGWAPSGAAACRLHSSTYCYLVRNINESAQRCYLRALWFSSEFSQLAAITSLVLSTWRGEVIHGGAHAPCAFAVRSR